MNTTQLLALAMNNLRPNADWVIRGDIVDWADTNQIKPTDEEIRAEVARLQVEAAANAYKTKRAREYPPIGDQLDALWKGGAEAEAMLAKVQAVKARYPKS